MYVASFKVAGTAAKYIRCVAKACTLHRLDMLWWGGGLTTTLKGAKKRHLRIFGGPARVKKL